MALPKSYAIAAGTFLFFPVNAWNATLGSEMRIVLYKRSGYVGCLAITMHLSYIIHTPQWELSATGEMVSGLIAAPCDGHGIYNTQRTRLVNV